MSGGCLRLSIAPHTSFVPSALKSWGAYPRTKNPYGLVEVWRCAPTVLDISLMIIDTSKVHRRVRLSALLFPFWWPVNSPRLGQLSMIVVVCHIVSPFFSWTYIINVLWFEQSWSLRKSRWIELDRQLFIFIHRLLSCRVRYTTYIYWPRTEWCWKVTLNLMCIFRGLHASWQICPPYRPWSFFFSGPPVLSVIDYLWDSSYA